MKKRKTSRKNHLKGQAQAKSKCLKEILFRYFFLLALGLLFSFSGIFYNLLLPLTMLPLNAILGIFYDSSVAGNFIYLSGIQIEIIPACVAVSAYFLLLILNLSVYMPAKKRAYSLLFSFFLLLLLNIIRIFLLAILLLESIAGFEAIHKLSWYFLSIVFVVGIWFLAVRTFKISAVPFYTDAKMLLGKP